MGFAYHHLNRLEAGIDGFIELRDPVTHALQGMWIGVQVKTTASGVYTREDASRFEYLLEPEDLEYWGPSNIPVIVVLVRLSDNSMFWQRVGAGRPSEPRRLDFDKSRDVFARESADAVAALAIDKHAFGTFVPPMQTDEPAHLNLVRLILPQEVFVAETAFRSGREAVREMYLHEGPKHFDWVIRDRSFWSFRDPRGTVLEEIVDAGSVEAVDTEFLALLDDADDENSFIELLRRSVEAQLATDLFFDKDSRALAFRATALGATRTYAYRSLQNATDADVVSLVEKEGRDAVMRHHAFLPRYQRIGNDWFVSITPTFVFTADGYRTHPASGALLAGKKKLEHAPSIRGQFLMWRHLLVESGEARARNLLDDPGSADDPRPKIRFQALEPVSVPRGVPEELWRKEEAGEAAQADEERLL